MSPKVKKVPETPVGKLVNRILDLEDKVVDLHEKQVTAGVIDPALTRAITRAAKAMSDVSLAVCKIPNP